ncbi:MAG: hypothetical protein M3Y07_18840 [Acidobacteriota bacterium]|nr:hypothetical protein [Acidobacteriota bacterium]
MRLPAIFFITAALLAQTPAPTGFVRGILVEVPGAASLNGALNGALNQFTIRSGAVVYRFGFDSKTWIEKQQERIPGSALNQGDIAEVVCDRDATPIRYARMVQVIDKTPRPRPPAQAGLYRMRHSPVEFIAPRGDLTFSGIVASLTDEHLVLRTRFDGEKIIYRRKDTNYLERGFQVEPGVLQANTRVFLRAGRNLDNELEAYQVIWGEIFDPNGRR